jgi:hypothetical protein
MLDPLLIQDRLYGAREIFPSAIRVQGEHFVLSLIFCPSKEPLEGSYTLIFGAKEVHHSMTRVVINEAN